MAGLCPVSRGRSSLSAFYVPELRGRVPRLQPPAPVSPSPVSPPTWALAATQRPAATASPGVPKSGRPEARLGKAHADTRAAGGTVLAAGVLHGRDTSLLQRRRG